MSRATAELLATVAALATTGCYIRPDPPTARGGELGDAATVDGDGDGSGSSGECKVRDNFDAPALECGDWAANNSTGSVTVTHNTGELRMVPMGGGTALCTARDPVDIQLGARVDITAIWSQMYAYTGFEVVDAVTSTRVGVRITGNGASPPTVALVKESTAPINTQAYDSLTMVKWQLRRELVTFATAAINSTDVVLEYTAGGPWIELGRVDVGTGLHFTSAMVRLIAVIPSGTPPPAAFDNLDACN